MHGVYRPQDVASSDAQFNPAEQMISGSNSGMSLMEGEELLNVQKNQPYDGTQT